MKWPCRSAGSHENAIARDISGFGLRRKFSVPEVHLGGELDQGPIDWSGGTYPRFQIWLSIWNYIKRLVPALLGCGRRLREGAAQCGLSKSVLPKSFNATSNIEQLKYRHRSYKIVILSDMSHSSRWTGFQGKLGYIWALDSTFMDLKTRYGFFTRHPSNRILTSK